MVYAAGSTRSVSSMHDHRPPTTLTLKLAAFKGSWSDEPAAKPAPEKAPAARKDKKGEKEKGPAFIRVQRDGTAARRVPRDHVQVARACRV